MGTGDITAIRHQMGTGEITAIRHQMRWAQETLLLLDIRWAQEKLLLLDACYGHRYQLSLVSLSGTGEKKGKGVRGDRLHWWVQGSTSSPTGIGSRRRLV